MRPVSMDCVTTVCDVPDLGFAAGYKGGERSPGTGG